MHTPIDLDFVVEGNGQGCFSVIDRATGRAIVEFVPNTSEARDAAVTLVCVLFRLRLEAAVEKVLRK